MVSTDPIADMLTRIRNALAVNKTSVVVPHSKMKSSVAEILAESKFIDAVKTEGEGISKSLVLTIVDENGYSPITELSRVSKPGRRTYAKVKDIPVVKRGRGLVIMSTSQGIMTGDSARDKKLGGEVICSVY